MDNDPLVLAHARALLTSSPDGRTAYIPADLRDPAAILSHPVTREVLDFSRPVALMLVAILHFVQDEAHPAEIVKSLVAQVTGTVRWRESILFMAQAGVTTFYEVGAGKVLTGLIKRIAPSTNASAIGTPDDVTKFKAILSV